MPVQKKKFHVGQKKFTWYCFFARKRPRSNLVIKVNFRGSFEIYSKTGVLIAEL